MPSSSPVFHGEPSGPLILVLEDQEKSVPLIERPLRDAGYETRVVSRLEDVLPAVRARRPLAIAIDANLPRRAGWPNLSEFWTEAPLSDIPCLPVDLYGRVPPGAVQDAVAVQKPLDPPSLLRTLREILAAPGRPAARILVIDDEAEIRKIVRAFLTRAGYEVEEAGSGEEGLRKALRSPPDAILLDLRMPGMDGFEVAERLKIYGPTMDVPVMVFTGSVLTDEERARLRTKVFSITQKGGVTFEKFLSHLKWLEQLKPVL